MKKIFSILFALVLAMSLGLVTATPVAAQSTVLDHFKCYPVYEGTAPYVGEVVSLEDQFGAVEAVVEEAKFFCNPVAKWAEEMPPLPPTILNSDNHLTLYSLYHEEEPQERILKVENQFGTQQLVVSDPVLLGVPTQKLYPVYHSPPEGLDHFLLYEVTEGTPVDVVVGLYDYNFDYYEDVLVLEPVYFANPVRKTHDGDVTLIENPEAYLVFYRIASYSVSGWVGVDNQFGVQELGVYVDEDNPALLAVPSEGEEQVVQYTLTISSTAGGSVTTPGEGTFIYDEGEVVSLVATPATGYGFVNWAGDVDTIANVNAATTTITMQGDYEITARFMGVVATKTKTVINNTVNARDEADTEVEVTGTATVTVARYEDNPGGAPPTGFITMGKYIDVYVTVTTEVTEVEIRLYYTDDELTTAGIDEESLRLSWLNGDEWNECSHSGVNTDSTNGYSGYIWAIITATSTPSLDDLHGLAVTDGGVEGPSGGPQQCGCFIATAAYGTDTAKEIDILREFRDEVLLPNSLGAEFVSLYYKTSPPIANFISQHEVLRTAVRVGFVDPIVAILNWSHNLWSERCS